MKVCHPKKTYYIAEARIKSDRVYNKTIAEVVRLDVLLQSYMPSPEIAILREKLGAEPSWCVREISLKQRYGRTSL